MVELVEVEPGRWRVKKPVKENRRAENMPLPFVISDIMEPTEQVDGKFYTSKRQFRAVGRAHGLTEIGTEKLKPRPKGVNHADKSHQESRKQAIGKAIAQFKAGRRIIP